MALMTTPPANKAMTAPAFSLRGIDGVTHTRESARGPNGLAVMFICNHCPYVQAVVDRIAATAKRLRTIDVGTVAIMPNDTANYPEDGFENMKKFAAQHGFDFPYVIDETQKVAQAYGAVCTPDFFCFDKNMKLVYRGRLDSAGKGAAKADTVPELFNAMQAAANGKDVPARQEPSMGCSVKWRDAAA
ncbi:MAG: redoxin domain-containing protein [Alphaproteobacteria bacterium]|nr:redoxin domain-containing protein [Alphaproteobacteria bacterium]